MPSRRSLDGSTRDHGINSLSTDLFHSFKYVSRDSAKGREKTNEPRSYRNRRLLFEQEQADDEYMNYNCGK